MADASKQIVELTACPMDDPEALRAAAVLAAYFNAEQTRAFRRLIWPRLAVGTAIAWFVEALTPMLPKVDFVAALLACGAVAIAAAIAEWRAESALLTLIASEGLRQAEIAAPPG